MREAGGPGLRRRAPGRPRREPGPLARAVARLVVRAADGATRLVTDLLGASPTAGRERISEAELRDLVAANTVLDPDERRIIDEVLVAGASLVREVMMPRTEVVFLAAAADLAEAARLVRAETHTRYPVVDGTHDDVVGFVHLRDVLLRPDARPVRHRRRADPGGEAAARQQAGARRADRDAPGGPPPGGGGRRVRRHRRHRHPGGPDRGAGRRDPRRVRRRARPGARRPARRGGRPAQPRRLRRADRGGAARRPVRDGRRVRHGRAGPAPGGRRRGAGAGRARPTSARPIRPSRPAGWLLRVLALDGRRVARLAVSAGAPAGAAARGHRPGVPAGRSRPAGPS